MNQNEERKLFSDENPKLSARVMHFIYYSELAEKSSNGVLL